MLLLHFRLNCPTSCLPDQSGALIRITRFTHKWCAWFYSQHLSPVRSATYIDNRLNSSLEVLVLNFFPPNFISKNMEHNTNMFGTLINIVSLSQQRNPLFNEHYCTHPVKTCAPLKLNQHWARCVNRLLFLITALEYQQQIKQLFDTMNESQAKEKK